jgi:hypothetical protein
MPSTRFDEDFTHQFRESGLHNKVRTTSVCLGHVIAAQFSESAKRSIFTIDDWDFIRDNEVNRFAFLCERHRIIIFYSCRLNQIFVQVWMSLSPPPKKQRSGL